MKSESNMSQKFLLFFNIFHLGRADLPVHCLKSDIIGRWVPVIFLFYHAAAPETFKDTSVSLKEVIFLRICSRGFSTIICIFYCIS